MPAVGPTVTMGSRYLIQPVFKQVKYEHIIKTTKKSEVEHGAAKSIKALPACHEFYSRRPSLSLSLSFCLPQLQLWCRYLGQHFVYPPGDAALLSPISLRCLSAILSLRLNFSVQVAPEPQYRETESRSLELSKTTSK
jgi:hypothetical protein